MLAGEPLPFGRGAPFTIDKRHSGSYGLLPQNRCISTTRRRVAAQPSCAGGRARPLAASPDPLRHRDDDPLEPVRWRAREALQAGEALAWEVGPPGNGAPGGRSQSAEHAQPSPQAAPAVGAQRSFLRTAPQPSALLPASLCRVAASALRADPMVPDPCAALLLDAQPEAAAAAADGASRGAAAAMQHLLVTSFLDRQVLAAAQAGVRQVVLLSDGFDARPLRLRPPRPLSFFDVSRAEPFSRLAAAAEAVSMRPAAGCVLRHVSADLASADDWRDEGWGEKLQRLGYRGDRPSLWVMQGLRHMPPDAWASVLGHAGALAMAGSRFLGEVPLEALGVGAEAGEEAAAALLVSRCAAAGFLAAALPLAAVAASAGLQPLAAERAAPALLEEWPPASGCLLVAAVQQRLSDAQAEAAALEIRLAEEAGDEEGFEDAP